MIALGVACQEERGYSRRRRRARLCDKANRPAGLLKLPEECRPFYELMQMAKLVPKE